MKKLLTIIFFVPLFCQAQNYLGAAKKDIKTFLKTSGVQPKDTVIKGQNILQYEDNAGKWTLYISHDTVNYYAVYSPLSEINQTITSFKDKKFDRVEKYKWVDYSHPAYEVIYEIKKYTDAFLTIISK